MKILYIANIRIPTEKAHGIQIMKMCEAFAKLGHEVELVVPRRLNPLKEDPFIFYNVEKIFTIRRLPTIDLVKWGRWGFLVQLWSFSEAVAWYTLLKKADIYYSRDEMPLLGPLLWGKRTVWEVHTDRWNFIARFIAQKVQLMVIITQGLKDFYVSKGVFEEKIHVAPDAVDIKQFDIMITKEEARKKTHLPQDAKIVLYTGHLYSWKGAHTLAQAAQKFGEDVVVVFVGGTDADVRLFRGRFGNNHHIHILGRKPHTEIPIYLKAADVVVLPNSRENMISTTYTSPMKLFEYMASGRPIVASDLPSLREILDDSTAFFAQADNVNDLGEVILQVLYDAEQADLKAHKALRRISRYSWSSRAGAIIDFIFLNR